MQLENKANLIVIVISFSFGISLFLISIITGIIMGHYLFGVIGISISILCILIGVIKMGKFKKETN